MNYKIKSLPADFYGVHIENEIDEKRLLYLVNVIGEDKLYASVRKVTEKYPDSKPFVSKLLKRYRVVVPVSVYAQVPVPIFRVYVLILKDHSKLKIGFSRNWISRAADFHATSFNPADLFDIDKSFSVLVGSKISEARALEKKALEFFRQKKGYQTAAPRELLCYGAGGRNEWFVGYAFDEMKNFLCTSEVSLPRSSMTLVEAMANDISRLEFSDIIH